MHFYLKNLDNQPRTQVTGASERSEDRSDGEMAMGK